jgi:hypothetical protein
MRVNGPSKLSYGEVPEVEGDLSMLTVLLQHCVAHSHSHSLPHSLSHANGSSVGESWEVEMRAGTYKQNTHCTLHGQPARSSVLVFFKAHPSDEHEYEFSL